LIIIAAFEAPGVVAGLDDVAPAKARTMSWTRVMLIDDLRLLKLREAARRCIAMSLGADCG
jgi:hypothetical protein